MFSRLIRASAPLLILAAAPAAVQAQAPVAPSDLMRHIEVLASDDYGGRYPGTRGERLTTAYITEQLAARGVEPAGADGSWFQPVPLVERTVGRHDVSWTANGRAIAFDPGQIVLVGRGASERIADAPVVFAGHGIRMPERGIDQLAGADLNGAVALIMLEPPEVEGVPSLDERVRALTEAGAAAVVTIVAADLPWEQVRAYLGGVITRRESHVVPAVTGTMPLNAAQRLVAAAGTSMDRLLNDQPGSTFRAVALPLRASFSAETGINRYVTNNVVGRLRGSGATGENVLFLAHWDHLGLCAPEGAADRICNGAVDNASGIAMMIEVVGRLAEGPRPARDILFLATTAEEMGLLGAEVFAEAPTVPRESIVAALNMDTVAIHPAGEPVAVIGRGDRALDAAIAAAVAAAGRTLDTDGEADAFVRRQDGWALARAGIPTVMVGGSFSDMSLLQGFLASDYHKAGDNPSPSIPLGGAAEDANLLVALGRRLADPALYRRAER